MESRNDEAVKMVYMSAARNNPEALGFLTLWHDYSHLIDDFIDNKEQDVEKFLAILANANILYSMPFYQKNAARLHLVVALITNAYADSIKWAEDPEQFKKQMADTLRFAGNEMVMAVAMINGGTTLMREISPDLRELAWTCHHKKDGTPE